MTTDTYNAPASVAGLQIDGDDRRRRSAPCCAGIGFAMAGLDRFYQAYLVAFVFWTGVALGSLGAADAAAPLRRRLGRWSSAGRSRPATRTLPVMAVLFLPIVPGMGHLYHWTHADVAAADPMIRDKAAYLNVTFFLVRAGAATSPSGSRWRAARRKWSAEQDATGDPALADEDGALSARRPAGLRAHRDLRRRRLD